MVLTTKYAFSLSVLYALLGVFMDAQAQLYIDGATVTVEAGTDLYLYQKGLTVKTNGTDGTIDNDGDIYVEGDWNNNATGGSNVFTPLNATGTVHFEGGTAQNLGGTESTDFENLTINKSADNVTLDEPITIHTDLTLTQGLIMADATNFPSFVDGATTNGGDADSYVDGPVKKTGNEAFIFPTGNGSYWARLRISAPDDATDAFTAVYTDGSYGDSSTDGTLNNVSTVEYWTLTEDNDGGTATSIAIRLYWEDSTRSGIDQYNSDLRVAHYNGTNWVDYGHATIYNGGSGTGYVESDPQSSFSPISLGSDSEGPNPLPIELLHFNAVLKGDIVDIYWTTATEINNSHFTVEKSEDGTSFERVAVVNGAGTSNTSRSYSTVDENPYTGISYYRLKQTDFDGKYEYSEIKPIEYNPKKTVVFTVYPNPVSSDQPFYIKAEGFEKTKEVLVVVRDVNGRMMYSKVQITDFNGSFVTAMDPYKRLPAGIYVIIGSSNNAVYQQKLIVR